MAVPPPDSSHSSATRKPSHPTIVAHRGKPSAASSRRRELNFAALVAAFMVFASLINSVGVIILQSIRTQNITKAQAGALQPFVDMPTAFSSILIGSVLPSLGLRRAMLATLALAIAACVSMPLFPHLWVSKLHLVIVGISFAATKVAVYTAIGTLTNSKRKHAALMSTVEGLFMFGILGGYWIFGSFSESTTRPKLSWLDAYWIFAALLGAAMLLLWRNPIHEQEPMQGARVGIRHELLFLARLALKPLIFTYAITDVVYVFLEQALGAWLPTFNAEIMHLPPSISIELSSEFSLSLAVGGLLGGAVLRRFRWFSVLSFCLAGIAAVVVIVLPLARHAPSGTIHTLADLSGVAFLFPAVGVFLGPINPAINSAVLSSLPQEHHSAMAGLIVVFSAIGGTTGALITGFLFQARGIDAFYLLLVPVVLLGVALAVFRTAVQQMP